MRYRFRAWDKNNKKFLEWDDIYFQDNCFNLLNGDLWKYEIMQSTNLTDENGVEVYGGT